MRKNSYPLLVLMILMANLALKVFLLIFETIQFNADEAIVALMARHILIGSRPIFFYGQAYMGSLDAYLVALGFWIFGQSVWVIRFVQILLYLFTIITTIEIGKTAFNSLSIGLLAAIFIAIPPVNVVLYTTASLGGYVEALLIGNLLLLIALKFCFTIQLITPVSRSRVSILIFIFGLLAGIGLWANAITLVFTVPAGVMIFWVILRSKEKSFETVSCLGLGLLGCFLGSFPWWLYAFKYGFANLISELMGNVVAVETGSWLSQLGSHLFNLVVLGGTALIGLRPPWEIRWLALPLAPIVLAFWIGICIFWIKEIFLKSKYKLIVSLLAGIGCVLAFGFLFTSFGVDPSGRYFLPLVVPMALVAAYGLTKAPVKKWMKYAVVGTILAANLWGTIESGLRNPPGLTTQFDAETLVDHRHDLALIEFLDEQKVDRGYSTYWISYPIAFLSEEKIILSPRLPYHKDLRYSPRDDRYPLYTQLVKNSPTIVFVTSVNPKLDEFLRKSLKENAISWSETLIGDYRVFFDISRPFTPDGMIFD